jgi:hypothetical protein
MPPQNAVAVAGDELDETMFLGRLVMFTLPEEERSTAQLVREWDANGLDVSYLPDARQPVHVFQSACASVKSRTSDPGAGKVEIAADEVEHNGVSTYQITRRVWDVANRSIEHEKAMRLTFTKDTGLIDTEFLAGRTNEMKALDKTIRKHFEANAKTIKGTKIRKAVRSQLIRVGGQNMRRKAGGVYFVPRVWFPAPKREELTLPVLDGLAGVLEALYGDRADFHQIPLVSGDAEKQMVAKHFKLNVRERAEELTERAVTRVRQGRTERPLRQEMLDYMHNDRRQLALQIAQFRKLVDVEADELQTHLDELDTAIEQLEALAAPEPATA